MIGCLLLLALAPSLGWELWHVAVFCAVLQAAYNFVVMAAARHWHVRTSYDGRQQLQVELEKQVRLLESESVWDHWFVGPVWCRD